MSLVVQASKESLDNYSKYQEKMEQLMNFGYLIMQKKPNRYAGQQVLSVTPLVVRASGRHTSSTWGTWSLIFVRLLGYGVIFKVDRLRYT